MKAKDKKNRKNARAANAGRRVRRRAGKRTLHHLLLSMFILAAGAILCLTVFFKVETVSVIGCDKYDPVTLAEISGVKIGDNLLRIQKEAIKQALFEGHPYIEAIEVTRRLPSTVMIQITQSVPHGAVKEGEDYVLITKDGKVLERGTFYIPENIPLIKGLDTAGTYPGDYLGTWEKTSKADNETDEQKEARLALDQEKEARANRIQESLVMLDNLFTAMEGSGFSDITNVDITDRLNMTIMYENRLLLELGIEADLPYKLEMVKYIIENGLEPDARGTIRAGNAKTQKVVFSPAEDSGAETDKPEQLTEDPEKEAEQSSDTGNST